MVEPEKTDIRWFLITVPHSGTRYVRSCFMKSLNGAHSYSSNADPKPGTKLLWGHFCIKHLDRARKWSDYLPNKTLVMLRDPLMCLSTFINLGAHADAATNAIAAMSTLDREYDYKYFPVETTRISDISNWAGLGMQDTQKHFSSGTNELKEAAKAKDLAPFRKQVDNFETYLRTVNTANHIYEQAGYDIWWDK